MEIRTVNKSVNVPLDLILLGFQKKSLSRLKVLVAAKLATKGIFVADSATIHLLSELSGFQPRTVRKHLADLVADKLAGFDPITNTYYIRSWASLRSQNMLFHRLAVPVAADRLHLFRELMITGLFAVRILPQMYFLRKSAVNIHLAKRKRKKSAITKWGIASQDRFLFPDCNPSAIAYTGLSNEAIAKMACLSVSRACKLKHDAEAAGFISTAPRFRVLHVFNTSQPALREKYAKYTADKANIRFLKSTIDNKPVYLLVAQLHDHIRLNISIKRVNYLRLYKKALVKQLSKKYKGYGKAS